MKWASSVWALLVRAFVGHVGCLARGNRPVGSPATWLALLLTILSCASQDQGRSSGEADRVGSVSQRVVTTCGSNALPVNATWVSFGFTFWQARPWVQVGDPAAPPANLDVEFTEPPGITGVYVNWLCVRAYLRNNEGVVTYLGTSSVSTGTHQCGSGQCLRRVSYDMSSTPPGTYELLLAADDQDTVFARATVDVLDATIPQLSYRNVSFARDFVDYVPLPTPTPVTTVPLSPVLRRTNRFLLSVPTERGVGLVFNVGNTTLPSNPRLDVLVSDQYGTAIKTKTVTSVYPGQRSTTWSLTVIPAGNYLVDISPQDDDLTYTVRTADPAVPLVLVGGADLAQPSSSLYFFVPSETETALLVGSFAPSAGPQFFGPDGAPVTPTVVNDKVYAFNTRGRPGVWRTTYQTATARAHLINLPDVFSFDPNAVITSKRIRTDMTSPAGAGAPVTSPTLRYNNRFSFRVVTASSPIFTIGSSTTSGSPQHITARLIDASGVDLSGSPFDVTPGVTKQVSVALQPGEYELHVTNPSLQNSYSITVPAGIPFASVDGYGLGDVWQASYRAFFNVPAGTSAVRFAAKPITVPITVYNPSGTSVGQPTALGNNVYEIPNTTGGAWSINLSGDAWSDIRLLNVPQLIAFDQSLLRGTAGGGVTTCSVDADCPVGQVCGTNNGTQFGLSASADVCWPPACTTGDPAPELCGSTLSPCGTCTCTTAPDCGTARTCVAGHCSNHCSNGIKDSDESDIDCGGACGACSSGKGCNADTDCGSGLACGTNNGGYFNLARSKRVCWSTTCQDGVDSSECGQATSACGPNCDGVKVCDPTQSPSGCPAGEVCKAGLGALFGLGRVAGVCVDPICPSNDETKCGRIDSLCGQQCICTPDCSHATAADPSDGCGGQCPNVCPLGQACCTQDVHCPTGAACIAQPSGPGICRSSNCLYKHLEPPLCGHAGAECGDTCPACTETCGTRECGTVCGVSCGSCPGGGSCSASGQCAASAADHRPHVPDGSGGNVDLPPLTAGPTAPVGALAGQFSVSEQGTAHYSIPIEVPPGRAGMQPALSIAYAGPRVEGNVGSGWKLEGLSQITRCPKVYALDGYSAPIKNNATDSFCIDGKRLERVAGAAYGTDGAEYRTMVDTFTKVVSHVEAGTRVQDDSWQNVPQAPSSDWGPDWFQVWTKDGRILTYGKTREALILARNGVRASWLLLRVEDHDGNYMSVDYENKRIEVPAQLPALAANVVVPREISYTGHGTTDGNRHLKFDYETRTDGVTRFAQGGVPIVTRVRLRRVRTYVGNQPVKNYRLDYESDSRSLIQQVVECAGAGDGTCKPPTVFEYNQEIGFEPPASGNFMSNGAQLDANGDGIPDYLSTNVQVDGLPAHPIAEAGLVGLDVAIGAASMATAWYGGIAINLVWSIAKAVIIDAFDHSPNVTYSSDIALGLGSRLSNFQVVNGITRPCGAFSPYFLDYDQDGKDDMVVPCGTRIMVGRSAGDGNFPQLSGADVQLPDDYIKLGRYGLPRAAIYDVNGDSLQDIVSCSDQSTLEVRLRRSPTQGYADPIKYVGLVQTHDEAYPDPPYHERIPFCTDAEPTYYEADVDGDGTPEMLVSYQPTTQDKRFFPVARQAGAYKPAGAYALRLRPDQHLEWQAVGLPNVGSAGWGKGAVTGDFNGDGLVDVWSGYDEKSNLWVNTGGGFELQTLNHPRPALDQSPIATFRKGGVLDYDGDGKLDVLESWAYVDDRGGETATFAFDSLVRPIAPSGVTAILPPDLKLNSPATGNPQVLVDLIRDMDGDGSGDVVGQGRVFYGRGLKNGLLTQVTDGLGNSVHVDYDDAYDGLTCQGSTQWPEQCLKRMKGLVSGYSVGFNYSDADGVGHFREERRYDYHYKNAHVSVTGHGWLGFDQVGVTEQSGSQTTTITTEYEPPTRFGTGGVPQTTGSPVVPYLYPFAGLPRVVTVDQSAIGGGDAAPTLEDQPHTRRTQTTNVWTVVLSGADRPYPLLTSATTKTFSRSADTATPFTDNGEMRTDCQTINSVNDAYGNVLQVEKKCWVIGGDGALLERVRTSVDTYTFDSDNWLIQHPANVQIRAYRFPEFADEAPQNYAYTYYPTTGDVASVTREPNGDDEETSYSYDAYGNVVFINKTGPLQSDRTTVLTYDDDKMFPIEVQNAEGFRTQVHVDPGFGDVDAVVAPNGVSAQQSFDGFGRRTLSLGPAGWTAYTYSALPDARVFSTAGADDALGQHPYIFPRVKLIVEETGTAGTPGGHSEQLLDPHGRVVRATSVGFAGAEVTADRVFDARGRVTAASVPHTSSTQTVPFTSYQYDYLDRVTLVTLPDGATSEHQYGSGVHLSADKKKWIATLDCILDPENCGVDVELTTAPHRPGDLIQQTATVRDWDGLVVRTVDGNNLSLSNPHTSDFAYQAFGRLSQLSDNLGAKTEFQHDQYGRTIAQLDPDTGTTVYTYTPFGEVSSTLDAKSQHRIFSYDRLGRMISALDESSGTTSCPNYPTAGCTIWNYDGYTSTSHDTNLAAIGQISETISPPTAESSSGQQVLYDYESPTAAAHRGLLKSIHYLIDSVPYDVNLHYDDLARPQRIDYPDLGGPSQIQAQYQYDPQSGALAGLTEVGGNATRPIWNVQDAFQGQLPATIQFGNGATTTLGYDPGRFTLNSVQTVLGTQTVQNLGYARFGTGQIHEFNNIHGSQLDSYVYDYDPLGRLSHVMKTPALEQRTDEYYGFDDHGNMYNFAGKTIDYPSNPPHLPDAVGLANYFHDANGNLDHRTGTGVPGGYQSFTYTPFDLPRTITTGTATPHVTSFDYSADQERVVRRDPTTTEHFVGGLYERKLSSTGDTLEEHFRLNAGGNVVAEIIRTTAGDHTLFFHPDALGTPQTYTDDAGTTFHQDFTPFGTRADAATSSLTRLGFTSQYQDDDLALIDMGGRIYDPLAGRFTSADPVMQAPFSTQGQNRFAYVFNDPINLTDPSGFVAGKGLDGPIEGGGLDCSGGGLACGFGAFVGTSGILIGIAASQSSGIGVPQGGAGPALGLLGTGLNVYQTVTAPGLQGRSAQHYGVANPGSAAPTATGSPPNGVQAVGQQIAPATGVQERADLLKQRLDEMPDKRLAMIPCNASPDECAQRALDTQLSLIPGGGVVIAEEEAVSVGARLLINLFGRLGLRAGIEVTEEGLAHVLARHIIGGAETAGKSIFAEGANVRELASAAEKLPAVKQVVGKNFQRIVNAGRVIGTTFKGEATEVYTVITNAKNELVTMFPGVPGG